MGHELWERLPPGLLRMKPRAWHKLDYDVRRLIVDLAERQKLQCVFCSTSRSLEIEHDHYPDIGTGDRYTVYNIRGLVCRRCNWHLMVYEKEDAGDYLGWDNVS